MSDRTIHMLTGLPRSGSTLLCNLLMQNPDIYCSPTSGLSTMLSMLRANWDMQPAHRANDCHNRVAAMRGLAQSYHRTDRPIVFDKSREWPSIAELSSELFPNSVMIATVRPVTEILASMELRWRETVKHSIPPDQRQNPQAFANIESRCAHWMQPGGVVFGPLSQLNDALRRGHGNRIALVDFEAFCRDPISAVGNLYDSLGIARFAHDAEQVEDHCAERDDAHGYADLHTMRSPKIEPVQHRAEHVLGAGVVKQYQQWDQAVRSWFSE
jgi:sulfotransferase